MELESDFADTQQPKKQEQEQEQKQEQEQEQKQEQEKQQQQHFHVLAVDDSQIDRKLLERLLRVSSYQVTCVESGDKALEYLGLVDNMPNKSPLSPSSTSTPLSSQQKGLKVNLIMTDYCMPGMNGYDLLKRVKGSTWKDVPVVIMSSENVPSRITMCLEGGAEGFLLKPLQLSDVEKLQPFLLKSLNHYNMNRANININGASKRKAVSPGPSESERRPKFKELAVL